MDSLSCTLDTVFRDEGRLYTQSSCIGKRPFKERTKIISGKEYHEWDPKRSKLSAYLSVGGKSFPFRYNSNVLYLGASSGTTPSHIADITSSGKVYCVEFSRRMFRELVQTCNMHHNMIPILGDAKRPDEYLIFVDNIDIVYQDVAQKRQADIICNNINMFNAKFGVIAVKARSEDVTASSDSIFKATELNIHKRGFKILDSRSLEPYEKAHKMIIFRRG